MLDKLFKKGLVVGIIVLFICMGIQPAISNEVTIPKISDIEEDCNCNIPTGKMHLTEKILNKVETYIESKDLIKSDTLPFERPVCKMLESIGINYAYLTIKYDELARNTTYGTALYWYYVQLHLTYLFITLYIVGVGVILFCWEAPDWGPPPY